MFHLNDKFFAILVNYEMIITDKKLSFNLENNLEYHRIQESLLSGNLTEYNLCKRIFLYVSLYPKKNCTSKK